jgi:hypothetical protein
MNGPTRKRAAARGRRGVPRRLACSLYGEIQRRRPPRDRPALGAVAQPVSHIPRTRGPNGGPQPTVRSGRRSIIVVMHSAESTASSGEIARLIALGIPGPYRLSADGKEGVAGSSPAEGSQEGPLRRVSFAPHRAPSVSSRRVWKHLASGRRVGRLSSHALSRSPGRRRDRSPPRCPPGRSRRSHSSPGGSRFAAAGTVGVAGNRRFTVTLRVSAVDDYSSCVVVAIR